MRKKWAFIAAMVVVSFIAIGVIHSKVQNKNQNSPLSELSFDELDLNAHPGIGFRVVYESNQFIVFWGAPGLFGYDLVKQNVTFEVDFIKAYGEQGLIQGSHSTYVEVSPDGRSITIKYDTPDVVREAYYIDVPTLTYRRGRYEPMESIFGEENAVGYVMPGAKIGDTVYIRGDNKWTIFGGYSIATPAPQAEIVQSNMSDNVDIQVNEVSPNYFSSQSMFFLGSFEEMTRDEILSQFGIPLDLSTVMPNMQEAEDTCYGFYHLGNGGLFYQFTFKYVDIETEQIISITLRNNGLPITMINEAYENELQKSILCGQEVMIAHYTDLAGASTYYGEFSDGDLGMMIIAMDCSIGDFIRALEYLIQL